MLIGSFAQIKELCALFLDVYTVHRATNIKDATKKLGITLIYAPVNCTGIFQPLDR